MLTELDKCEAQSLFPHEGTSPLTHSTPSTNDTETRTPPKKSKEPSVLLTYLVFCVIVLLTISILCIHLHEETVSTLSLELSTPILQYQCPVKIAVAQNDVNDTMQEFYDTTTNEVFEGNEGPPTIPNQISHSYDGYRHSFNEMKDMMYGWKKHYFSNLQSGDLIYESACGMGFNLAMTLQILEETRNVTNLTVYGNDYLGNSVTLANRLFDTYTFANATKGHICTGDSTDLNFVPSDTFDVAYTGYIDQIQDHYNIYQEFDNDEESDTMMKTLCNETVKKRNNQEYDWGQAKLAELDQVAQEDWYAKWVSELVRIAKPGGSIIVEQIALPQCDNFNDWGGVSRPWWNEAIIKYGWNIHNNTVITEDVKGDNGARYNIFMKKGIYTFSNLTSL